MCSPELHDPRQLGCAVPCQSWYRNKTSQADMIHRRPHRMHQTKGYQRRIGHNVTRYQDTAPSPFGAIVPQHALGAGGSMCHVLQYCGHALTYLRVAGLFFTELWLLGVHPSRSKQTCLEWRSQQAEPPVLGWF
ncbi:unnamed protein product [Ostreobium quekettii]|uniref:Uncharacterized protein n=1 Tax=Ostreobium quekettii TaxID=121088 RepID=A0A8S1JDQ7_9CHLO|nr:unnamed protein product [Ostreobium quekettii]|eukprot:evm.model.scf_431.4 EVM.evm.TU.scf_431.4   scf_431:35840-36241(+)